MIVFLSICFILLGCFVAILEHNIYNPFTIFITFWGAIGFLLTFRLFGLYPIENMKTYYVFFLGLLFYAIGCFFTMRPLKHENLNLSKKISFDFNYKLVDLAYLTSLVFIMKRLMIVVPMLLSGTTMKQIRKTYLDFDEGITSAGLEGMVEQFVLRPLNFVFIIILSVLLFDSTKSKRIRLKYSIFSIVILVLYSISTGGARINFFLLLMVSVFSFLIFNNQVKKEFRLSSKQKMFVIIMSVSMVGLLYIFTTLRDPNGTIFNMLYRYFVGPIKHMDMWINTMGNDRTNGALFIHGLLRPITGVLKSIGIINDHPQIILTGIQMHSDLEKFTYIGPGMLYNAFVTTFFYFYADFGMLGVCLGSLFYGGISGFFYLKMKKNFNLLNLGFFLLIILGYYTSMVRWPFYESKYVLAFIFYRLLFQKKGKKNEKSYN